MTPPESSPGPAPHNWSKDALLAKAQRFAEEMLAQDRESWQFAFWSAATLELTARAALAHVHVALLADPKDWDNLYFALGNTPKAAKYVPRSILISEVFNRLQSTLVLDPQLGSIGIEHMAKRNEDMHSGGTPFDGLKNSAWLPSYYRLSERLLQSMGETLDSLLGEEEAKVAAELIAADLDKSAKAVKGTIEAHRKGWESKSDAERAIAASQASAWALRTQGHRVACPSCGSMALLTGAPCAEPQRTIEEDHVVITQDHLPSRFECISCGLKVSGYPQLHASGLGDPFKAMHTLSLAEFFQPQDPYEGFEDDMNEY